MMSPDLPVDDITNLKIKIAGIELIIQSLLLSDVARLSNDKVRLDYLSGLKTTIGGILSNASFLHEDTRDLWRNGMTATTDGILDPLISFYSEK